MPVHDWSRVNAGTFHAFHNAWITHLQEALNDGVLPPGYYALGEQRAGQLIPDLLTLHAEDPDDTESARAAPDSGGVMLAQSPPKVAIIDESDTDAAAYLSKQRTLVIRHASGDRMIAIVEIVSPANKRGALNVQQLVQKSITALGQGYHLLLIDLFVPGANDPQGIHGEVWDAVYGTNPYESPPNQPLTLASYCAGSPIRCFVEPLAVDDALIDMPLFLASNRYINTPLERTYQAAWRGLPQRWKQVLEGH
jgi:hypothetical protein